LLHFVTIHAKIGPVTNNTYRPKHISDDDIGHTFEKMSDPLGLNSTRISALHTTRFILSTNAAECRQSSPITDYSLFLKQNCHLPLRTFKKVTRRNHTINGGSRLSISN